MTPPRKALVVDDSMLIRHSVCRYLDERGFIVASAVNGAEALTLLKTFRPDFIITDISMPEMNGNEFIAALKDNPRFRDIPIIVLTARSSKIEIDRSTDLRADAIIHKDIDIEVQLPNALSTIAQNR